MIKFDKKIGFSLAESLISMMLLVLIIMITMTTMTRKKIKPISNKTINGMYACWEENSKLRQMQYHGNKKVFSDLDASSCIFELDRRVSSYYILATGSRKCYNNKCVDGQVIQKIINSPSGENSESMKFKIIPNQGERTLVLQGDTILAEAIGGIEENSSGLVVENISGCSFISDSPCTDGSIPKCVKESSEANIKLNCSNGDIWHLDNMEDLTKSPSEEDLYTGKFVYVDSDETFTQKNVKIKLNQSDIYFKAIASDKLENSQFLKYFSMIPAERRNGLTDSIYDYYKDKASENPSSNERSGIVLIMW